jgi:hypothetical protein
MYHLGDIQRNMASSDDKVIIQGIPEEDREKGDVPTPDAS